MNEFIQNHKNVIAAIAAIIIAFCSGYFLGIRQLHDYGGGADTAREQLEQAAGNQSAITDGLGDAAAAADGVAESIDDSAAAVDNSSAAVSAAQGSADSIAAGEQESAELIADSQRILGAVRARGKSETTDH